MIQTLTTPDETARPAAPTASPEPPAVCFTVLLAEDDRALRRYLEVVLRRAGYEVVAASDGLEAMKAALTGGVHAVVTDAVMPHLGGRELCRFLRRHPKLKGLPLILLSGSDGADAAACEADIHLSKPVRPEELGACLARLLEQ